MDLKQLDAIANRKTTCHPSGETVTLSRAERYQVISMAKALVLAADLLQESSAICGAVIRAGQDNTGAVRNHQEWVDQFLDTLRQAAAEIGKNMEKV